MDCKALTTLLLSFLLDKFFSTKCSYVYIFTVLQVCVSTCPTANEFGVRPNPVCVDGVNTTPFANINSVDLENVTSVTDAASNVAVSNSLTPYMYTYRSILGKQGDCNPRLNAIIIVM